MARIETLAEGVTLYLGDCMDILPGLPKHDALVADPPYKIGTGGMGVHSIMSDSKRRQAVAIRGNLDMGFDVSVLGGYVNWFVFCSKAQIVELIQQAEKQGLKWQILTWNKTNPSQFSNLSYLPDTEYMIHGYRAHKFKQKSRFLVGSNEASGVGHPTVKPQYVMRFALMSASFPGDAILDPYMGSGSTGVAAVKMGRKFTGIEISEKYFDIACKRIEQALAQPDMFINAPVSVPKQGFFEDL